MHPIVLWTVPLVFPLLMVDLPLPHQWISNASTGYPLLWCGLRSPIRVSPAVVACAPPSEYPLLWWLALPHQSIPCCGGLRSPIRVFSSLASPYDDSFLFPHT